MKRDVRGGRSLGTTDLACSRVCVAFAGEEDRRRSYYLAFNCRVLEVFGEVINVMERVKC